MSEIKVLPDDVVAKIAAGEVIERPDSILKELLENSADSGAKRIDIEIEKAGRSLIRVRDDGKGMPMEDMKLALLRHGTSKLRNFDDIYSLSTYGFRGEALYSVFAVSRLKMISFAEGEETGFALEGEGGKIISMQPAPPVKGTVIEARDIFFNVPARAKFLKSAASERAHLIRTAEEAVLANCGIAFSMRMEDAEIFSVPLLPEGLEANLRRRAETVFGKKVFSGMKEISFKGEGISVYGYVSVMNAFCSTRANQYYFVNRRPVASQLLKQALYKAYPVVPLGKHPACVLFLELDPSAFDVNVHPQKRDVKFADDGAIFAALAAAVRSVTDNRISASDAEDFSGSPAMADYGNSEKRSPEAMPVSVSVPQENLPPHAVYGHGEPPGHGYADYSKEQPFQSAAGLNQEIPYAVNSVLEAGSNGMASSIQENVPIAENGILPFNDASAVESIPGVFRGTKNLPPADPATAWRTESLKYIGQLASSYLLFECARGLLAVDQHAAQERVFFERYLEELADKNITRQPLLIPIEANLTRSQTENVMRWKDWLESAGFEIDARGPATVALRSAPSFFEFSQNSFTEFVSYLSDIIGNPSRVAEEVKRNLIATMACKKAVKARDVLNKAEAEEIMKGLRLCRDGAHCPHGRPTMFYMTGLELAKKFDRNTVL